MFSFTFLLFTVIVLSSFLDDNNTHTVSCNLLLNEVSVYIKWEHKKERFWALIYPSIQHTHISTQLSTHCGMYITPIK